MLLIVCISTGVTWLWLMIKTKPTQAPTATLTTPNSTKYNIKKNRRLWNRYNFELGSYSTAAGRSAWFLSSSTWTATDNSTCESSITSYSRKSSKRWAFSVVSSLWRLLFSADSKSSNRLFFRGLSWVSVSSCRLLWLTLWVMLAVGWNTSFNFLKMNESTSCGGGLLPVRFRGSEFNSICFCIFICMVTLLSNCMAGVSICSTVLCFISVSSLLCALDLWFDSISFTAILDKSFNGITIGVALVVPSSTDILHRQCDCWDKTSCSNLASCAAYPNFLFGDLHGELCDDALFEVSSFMLLR